MSRGRSLLIKGGAFCISAAIGFTVAICAAQIERYRPLGIVHWIVPWLVLLPLFRADQRRRSFVRTGGALAGYFVMLSIYFTLFALHIRDDFASFRQQVPTPLIDGLPSRLSVADMHIRLSRFSDSWVLLETSALPASDPRPRLDIVAVSVSGYEHMSVKGTLRLRFLNDRLASTWFYPVDSKLYLQSASILNLSFTPNPTRIPDTNTEIWSSTDYMGYSYWAWEDITLSKEEFDWISRYAAVTAKPEWVFA